MKAGTPRTGAYPRIGPWLGCAAVIASGWLGLSLSSCAHVTDDNGKLYGDLDALDSSGGSSAGDLSNTSSAATTSGDDGGPAVVFNCAASDTLCDGICTNLMTDPENCGVCGATCQTPDTCVDGACGCPNGREKCGDSCVFTSNDVANCGGCGIACGTAEVCSAGVCASSCDETETLCGESCVNLDSSAQNCGACGNACAAGETCMAGGCAGGASTTGGNVTTGGATTGGATTGFMPGNSTNGGGMPCTNVRPTGTEWDEATCDQWASETSECNNAWMVDNNYCNDSCGRC